MRSLLIIFGLILAIQSYAQEYNQVIVFLNSKPDKETITTEVEEALQKAHIANIDRLVKEGKMIVAGPFDGGGGIFILTTGDASVARAWLDSDPAVKANRWDVDLYPVQYLLGGACLAKEPYEMVNYNFIRVSIINEIANYKMNKASATVWGSLIQAEDILMTGIFPQEDGGIIIYSGQERTDWFGKYQDEQVSLTHKNVWVAKGSFCE